MPDARIITPEQSLFRRPPGIVGVVAVRVAAVLINNARPEGAPALDMGMGGQRAGPGNVAMADWVESIGTFAEGPLVSIEAFAKRKIVGGDVLLGARESFLGDGELVHEGEAKVVFLGSEVDLQEAAGVMLIGFPADLATEARFVASSLKVAQVLKKIEEDGFKEMPIFGAAGEEGAEREFVAAGFVDVDRGQVALAGGGDVEAETIRIFEF